MKTVQIPNTELHVSALAYGTASFDGSFSTDVGLQLFEQYIEAGGNFIDTAHCYCFWVPGGDGKSEQFVGGAVKAFGRENLVIATKGGHVGMNGYPRPDAFMTPDIVARDIKESLDRLNLPSVDLYYLHRDDPRMPVGEIIESCNEFITAGLTRYLGASNWSVARYLEANAYANGHGLQPFVALQNQWSLAQQKPADLDSPGAIRYITEGELAPLNEHQIPVIPFSPTANGYFATAGARAQHYDSPENRWRLASVQDLAAKHGATPNQIALAYLMCQPFPVIPILGTLNKEHLADALESPKIQLSAEEVRSLANN
jgi:aryl-alcohol dehydrogenase-like predicted oxidoreductase